MLPLLTRYYGQVSFVDATVANVSAALRAKGLWGNTLFVWTTDNGSPVNSAGSNDPLRGGKGSLWEGGYRVPGFIGGGLLPAAKRGTRMVGVIHVSDWWPTFAAMAGLQPVDPSGTRKSSQKKKTKASVGGCLDLVSLSTRTHRTPAPCGPSAPCRQANEPQLTATCPLLDGPSHTTVGPVPLDGVDQSAYIMGPSGATSPSPRTEVVLDHLMHCVPGPGYDAAQCTRGQTPDFPAGHYPNHTAGTCHRFGKRVPLFWSWGLRGRRLGRVLWESRERSPATHQPLTGSVQVRC